MRVLPLLLAPLILAAAIAPAADDRGPGIPGARQADGIHYPVEGFSAVAFGGAGSMDVRVGPRWSLRITGPEAALADIRVYREGRTLQVGRRYREDRRGNSLDNQVRVYVTLPAIDSASVGGSGTIRVDRASGAKFEGAVGGSGALFVGALTSTDADFSLGGSGAAHAAGDVGTLKVSIGGSGAFDAPALHARRAEISAAGSGRVRADVAGEARVSLVGSGEVDLGARARCEVTKMGSGRVSCGR